MNISIPASAGQVVTMLARLVEPRPDGTRPGRSCHRVDGAEATQQATNTGFLHFELERRSESAI
jgi:hypothetical protein